MNGECLVVADTLERIGERRRADAVPAEGLELFLHRLQLNVHLDVQDEMLLFEGEHGDVDALVRLECHGVDERIEASQRNDVEIEVDAAVLVQESRAKEVAHVRNGEVAKELRALGLIQLRQARAGVDQLLVEVHHAYVRVRPKLIERAHLQIDVPAAHENEDETLLVQACRGFDGARVPSENIVVLRRLNEVDL